MMEQTNLSFVRGDDWPLVFTAKNAVTGLIYDITGSTWTFTMKTLANDLDASAVYQVSWTSHSDPTNGITTKTIPHATTAALIPRDYVYDVQILTQTGNVHTVAKGVLTVEPDITITVPT